MGTWIKLKDAEGKSGVRYREHPTRKHGMMPDRYYTLAFWWQGKTVTEALGWASEKVTPTSCFNILAELRHNQKTGKGPCTLAEMREQGDREREQARRDAEAQARRDVSFKSFFDETYMPDAKTRWKPETARKAEEHVKNWIDPVISTTPMRDLGLGHITRIKADLSAASRSPRQQQYVFRTFCMVWNAALDHGLVSGPCPTKSQSFRLPKVDNERQRYLTWDEEDKLLTAVLKKSKQAHDIAIVSIDAGLRYGEVAALTWGCIDIESGTLRVMYTKGGHDRNVPTTIRLKALFESMPAGKPSDLVFPNSKGKVQIQIPSSFKRGLEDAELNKGVTDLKMRASFHSLRHTYASRLVQSGADLYKVQRLLGHSTPVMTARYSKLSDNDLREAVETMERAKETKKGDRVIPLRRKVAG